MINCFLFILISGIIIFFIGRIIPRNWIFENSFPFNSFSFEQNGKIYEKLKIQKWKTKLPDASVIINKILPGFMPKKRLEGKGINKIQVLIKESCIAEANHFIAGLIGFYCIKIWNHRFSKFIAIINFLFNIPFILIQRYKRPRFIKILNNHSN